MFASRDMFGDEADVDEVPMSRHSRPPAAVARSQNSASFSDERVDLNQAAALVDDASSSNPAARKQKLAEIRQQTLERRKTKPLTGVMRANDGPASTTANPNASRPSTASSSFAASSLTRGPSMSQYDDEERYMNDNRRTSQQYGNGQQPVQAFSSQQNMISNGVGQIKDRDMSKDDQKVNSNVERDLLAQGIQPVFDPVSKPVQPTPVVKLDFSDMRQFLLSPVPKGTVIQCYIERNKKGLTNKMYPAYELYLEEGRRFLMASKKRSKNKTSNYLISMDKNHTEKESTSYLGKVRSNFVGTEFVSYDKGINPKELTDDSSAISSMTVRQEMAAVVYESNILGSRGPRKMTAIVPQVRKDGTRVCFRPLREEDGMVAKLQAGETEDLVLLQNKTPKWNDQVCAYVLNFQGRVSLASVKNFQLIQEHDPETVVLQFGRVSKDQFTMDVQYPLSLYQAFSICLSSFDYKLACE